MTVREAPQRNLAALTGLRGVAAVWVVLFHVFQFQGLPIIDHGYAGVDVFFLLSGFVLSHVYLRNGEIGTAGGYARFLGVRLARIYPLHVFTLGCLVLMVTGLPDFARPYSHADQRFGAGALVANLLLVQDWSGWANRSWNGPAWSLSAEWFAYLAFPVLLVPIRRIASTRLLIGLAVAALAGTIGMLNLAGYRTTDGTGAAGMVRMAGEFTAGCLLYAAFAKGWRFPTVAALVLMAGLLAVGMSVPACQFAMVFGFALMVVLAAQGRSFYATALQWRPVMLLGEISFSVYLTHWIIIQAFNWGMAHGLHWGEAAVRMAILAVVPAVSVATYRFVELPARRWGRRIAMADRPARGWSIAPATE